MDYLAKIELPGGKGSRVGVLTKDEATDTNLMAVCWVDRDRRYYISSCSSLEEGAAIQRWRWSQVDRTADAEPERVQKTIAQPKVCETYYKGCQKIDQHNRWRQANLDIENKLGAIDWAKRINMSIFGMIITDTYFSLVQGLHWRHRVDGSRDFH